MSTKKLSESSQTFLKVAGRLVDIAEIPAAREGPTLVFLHEGLGSIGLWRDFPAIIARSTGLGAVVYSRYGNGFSEALAEARPVTYMHDEASVLPELFEACGIERAVLIGHSDGASIALIAAGSGGLPVEAVIAEAPHVFVEPISVASIAALGQRYRSGDLRERLQPHHRDVDRTFFGWNDIWLDPSFRNWNIDLAEILMPVLAIQGEDDEYGTLAQLDAIAAHAAGNLDRIVLARCGHAPHRDRAATIIPLISDWITRLAID